MTPTMRLLLIVPVSLFVGGHLLGAGASAAIGTDLATALVVGLTAPPPAAGSTDGLLADLIRQSPQTAAVIAVVVLFLRHIRSNEQASQAERERSARAIDERANECHAVQREVARAIHENTTATKELRHSIERDARRLTSTMPKPPSEN